MKKLSTFKYAAVTTLSALFPLVASAATQKTLRSLIYEIVDYLTDFLFAMVALAVVVFVWQVIRYYILPNDDRKKAGEYVLWSVIGFFVILSLWGIVAILGNTFGLQNTNNTPQSWSQIQNLFPSNP